MSIFSPRRIKDPEGAYKLSHVRLCVSSFFSNILHEIQFKVPADRQIIMVYWCTSNYFLIKWFCFVFWGNLIVLGPPPHHLTEFSRERPNHPEADTLDARTHLHMNRRSHVWLSKPSALYVLFWFASEIVMSDFMFLLCFLKKLCWEFLYTICRFCQDEAQFYTLHAY